MRRMSQKDFIHIKTCSKSYGSLVLIDHVRTLVAHAEAIELELKVSKEDEEEAARRFGEAELNNVRLNQKVDQLKRELDESRADELLATKSADRLSTENDALRAQLKAKKVVLPRDVAEAIDKLRRQDEIWNVKYGRNFSLLDNVNQALRGKHGSKFINIIAEWIVEDRERRDILVSALVNGYTVEEPIDRDQRLRLDIQELFANWQGGGRITELAKDADRLLENHFSETAN